jgi:hypothetical protein
MIVGPLVNQDPTARDLMRHLKEGEEEMDREAKELTARLCDMRAAEGKQARCDPGNEFCDVGHLPGLG